jgi:hypothetical protein
MEVTLGCQLVRIVHRDILHQQMETKNVQHVLLRNTNRILVKATVSNVPITHTIHI